MKVLPTVPTLGRLHFRAQQLLLCPGLPDRIPFGMQTYLCFAVLGLGLLVRYVMRLGQSVPLRDEHSSQAHVLLEGLLISTDGTLEFVSSIGGQLNSTLPVHPQVRFAVKADTAKGSEMGTDLTQADDTRVRLSGFRLGLGTVRWTKGVEEIVELEETLFAVESAFVMESPVTGLHAAVDRCTVLIAEDASLEGIRMGYRRSLEV